MNAKNNKDDDKNLDDIFDDEEVVVLGEDAQDNIVDLNDEDDLVSRYEQDGAHGRFGGDDDLPEVVVRRHDYVPEEDDDEWQEEDQEELSPAEEKKLTPADKLKRATAKWRGNYAVIGIAIGFFTLIALLLVVRFISVYQERQREQGILEAENVQSRHQGVSSEEDAEILRLRQAADKVTRIRKQYEVAAKQLDKVEKGLKALEERSESMMQGMVNEFRTEAQKVINNMNTQMKHLDRSQRLEK